MKITDAMCNAAIEAMKGVKAYSGAGCNLVRDDTNPLKPVELWQGPIDKETFPQRFEVERLKIGIAAAFDSLPSPTMVCGQWTMDELAALKSDRPAIIYNRSRQCDWPRCVERKGLVPEGPKPSRCECVRPAGILGVQASAKS